MHSGHVSRPSLDEIQETLKYLLEEPPKDHSDAKKGVQPSFLVLKFVPCLYDLIGIMARWLPLYDHRSC